MANHSYTKQHASILTSDERGGGGHCMCILVGICYIKLFSILSGRTSNKQYSCFTNMDRHIAGMMTADELVYICVVGYQERRVGIQLTILITFFSYLYGYHSTIYYQF